MVFAEETEIHRQLSDVNKRYNALDIKIDERDDELDTAMALTERTKPVESLLSWAQATEVHLTQTTVVVQQASVNDIDALMSDLNSLKV